jgi:DNA-binding LytR/AlgR family response regulator
MNAVAPTALIADDEPHLAQALREQLLAVWPGLQVLPLARHGVQAAQLLAEHEPDVAFLDIQMPGLTGLQVAQSLEGRTRVVFVTAYDAFAVQAFEAEAVDYLLKPVKAERLAQCVQRLQRALAEPASDDARLAKVFQQLNPSGLRSASPLRWVRAGVGEVVHQIAVEDVLFFRADDKYTCVQTAQAEHLIRTPIQELIVQLDGEDFWQIHRSTIVNLRHLAGTRRDAASRLFVRMKGFDGELPVSRAYVHLFKAM